MEVVLILLQDRLQCERFLDFIYNLIVYCKLYVDRCGIGLAAAGLPGTWLSRAAPPLL